jgi:serine/threonine protein kinase
VTADGTPVLSDFGLAKMMEGTARLTRTGLTVGTPEYMSPEQAMGRAVGKASDLYSLAVMCYEMLTGRVPFTADTPVAVVLAHLSDTPPPPRTLNPRLSEAVEAALLRGLAKQPEARFESAVQMVETVAALALGRAQPDPAPPTPTAGAAPPIKPATDWSAATPSLDELEFQDVWVELAGQAIPFNPVGIEKAAQFLAQRLKAYQAAGWELIGTLRDHSIYAQGRSLRGPIIRGANLPLRRHRPPS